MDKLTLVFLITIFTALCCIHVNSLPLEQPLEYLVEDAPHEHIRIRRFTCDVLSVQAMGFKLNHAACGTHCLFRGRSGGYCNDKQVCVCG